MNWIDALADEETDELRYNELLGVWVSDRGVGLELLEHWLSHSYWRFDAGVHQFDGISEGLCLLAGIDPARSMISDEEYFPKFLLGSAEYYDCELITADNQWFLQRAIDEHVGHLRSIGLTGRVRVKKALELCHKNGLDLPWLRAANNDLKCAMLLPNALRKDGKFGKQIHKEVSSRGGQARASKNAITQLLRKQGKEEFERLRKVDFQGFRAVSSDRIIATQVANKIYHFLGKYVGKEIGSLPDLKTVESNVRIWLKNLPK